MNVAVFGMQWGDEGKGKIVDYLAEKADIVARFQGGSNAGHTVIVGNETLKLHLIPSGVAQNKKLVIGNGAVINPEELISEITELEKRGFRVDLLVSERVHLVFPYHLLLDGALHAHQGNRAAGSTKKGIAPVYADKYERHGLRVADLIEMVDNGELPGYVHKMVELKGKMLHHVFEIEHNLDEQQILDKFYIYANFFRKYSGNVTDEIYHAIAEGKNVLFEGAQGGLLDIDHGLYPYVTSSNTTLGGLYTGMGLGLRCKNKNTVDKVIGVVKAYTSRVGEGPLPAELLNETGNWIREKGHEYGTTTGRPRRIGWLDMLEVNNFVMVNGADEIALTRLDILSGLKQVKICVNYAIDDVLVRQRLATGGAIQKCRPLYEVMAGWDEDISNCRKFEDLPVNAQRYVHRIEEFTGVPVKLIGVGPERSQIIPR